MVRIFLKALWKIEGHAFLNGFSVGLKFTTWGKGTDSKESLAL